MDILSSLLILLFTNKLRNQYLYELLNLDYCRPLPTYRWPTVVFNCHELLVIIISEFLVLLKLNITHQLIQVFCEKQSPGFT